MYPFLSEVRGHRRGWWSQLEALRVKWHWLRRQTGKSNRNRDGGRELSVERLVFKLTNQP